MGFCEINFVAASSNIFVATEIIVKVIKTKIKKSSGTRKIKLKMMY